MSRCIPLPGRGPRASCLGPLAALLITLLGWARSAQADVVRYVDRSGQPKERTGTIVDYSSAGLVIETVGRRQLTVDAERVRQITTQWPESYTQAESEFEQRRFPQALEQYQQAIRDEQRRWAKRAIFARTIACLQNLDRLPEACDRFYALVQDDANTPHIESIPLAWLVREPPQRLQSKCEPWLDDQTAAARLLAASHLLPTAHREQALQTLDRLVQQAESPLIRTLAKAQRWRVRAVTATPSEIAQWEREVRALPAVLRSGPELLVGKAWAARQQWDAAALALLRAALVHDRHDEVTIEALWQAAVALEKQNRGDESARLYRELTVRFPTATLAAAARERLRNPRSEP